MIILMVNLGFWQLRRLDERRARNDDVRTAMEAPARDVTELLDTDAPDETAARVVGEYLGDASFLVANRTFDSQAGMWLATPVRLADGRVVIVSRGWVPRLWATGDDPRVIDTPTGTVTLSGRLHASVPGGHVGADARTPLPQVSRLDLASVEALTGLDVVDHWVQLEEPAPLVGELPIPVPPPSLDEGPHLSYAFQWFFFSTGTVVAYVLILRRRGRDADLEAVS
ncbi:MAG: SURF1 family protein [Acidimicrobiales bacterium]